MTTELLEQRIRSAYAKDSSDPPSAGFGAVVSRLDHRERVELSMARRSVRTPLWIALAAAAAVALLPTKSAVEPTPPSNAVAGSFFWPDLLTAQAVESSANDSFPILTLDGSLLKPGTWVYRRRPIGGAKGRPEWDDTVTIRTGMLNEEPAWVLIGSRGGLSTGGPVTGSTDTVWVRRSDLWPLARRSRLVSGYIRRTTYGTDSTVVEFEGEGQARIVKADGFTGTNGAGVVGATGMTLLQVVPLGPNWRGSFRVIGINNAGEKIDFRLGLKVSGSETIRVPAGTFDCWTVSFIEAAPRYTYWVSKRERWIVKSGLEPGDFQNPASDERVLVSVSGGRGG